MMCRQIWLRQAFFINVPVATSQIPYMVGVPNRAGADLLLIPGDKL